MRYTIETATVAGWAVVEERPTGVEGVPSLVCGKQFR